MTLFRQISILLGFVFVLLFLLITVLSFNILKAQTSQALYENVQNSVTSLSLSITNAGNDESSVKTLMHASFDNGTYEKIVFKNTDEKIVYELIKETQIDEDIPSWFIKFADIGEISALASVSEGWNVLGILEIYADRAIFYKQIYAMFYKLIQSISIAFIVLVVLIFYLLKYILRPLKSIDTQAVALMNNEFIIEEKIPFTKEFKSVVLSTNNIVRKFENMFTNTNEVLKTNKELLYLDDITKLSNRKYFVLKATEYLSSDSSHNKGFILGLSIKIDLINKTFGYVKTNELLASFTKNLKEIFSDDHSIIARLNGSEFVVLEPNYDEENIKLKIESFIKTFEEIKELDEMINIGLSKYDNEESIKELFTKIDYTISQAKIHAQNKYYYSSNIEKHKTKEEWRNIINESLEKDYFKIIYRDTLDTTVENFDKILLKTVSFELDYKNEIIKYGDFIASVIEQNRIEELYLYLIEKLFNEINTKVSIQLPSEFIEKLNSFSQLKELLFKYKEKNKELIFEIEEDAFNKNLQSTLLYIELFKDLEFKFAVFNFIANSNDYTYLKEQKPLYVKSSKQFLLESKHSLNMLKILTQSLDIKLIATSVDEVEEIQDLKNIGLNAFCGFVVSKL